MLLYPSPKFSSGGFAALSKAGLPVLSYSKKKAVTSTKVTALKDIDLGHLARNGLVSVTARHCVSVIIFEAVYA